MFRDDSLGLNIGLLVVFVTATCLGLLSMLAFTHTDFGLPDAAVTRHLFSDTGLGGGFGFDLRSLTGDFAAGFNLLAWAFAFVFPIVLWLVVAIRFVRRLVHQVRVGRRRIAPAAAGDLPSDHDPALVSTLWEKGSPAPEAIAGTVLSLAALRRIEIQDLPGRAFVLRILPDGQRGRGWSGLADGTIDGMSPAQALVLDALRQEADPNRGEIEGPPLWKSQAVWWPALRADAHRRAAAAGLAVRASSSRLVLLAALLSAIAYGLVRLVGSPMLFFLLAVMLPIAAALVTARLGYALTPEGRELRERWGAFARHLSQSKEVADAPPAAVVALGPSLAYGAVLGVAREAARVLTPDVPRA